MPGVAAAVTAGVGVASNVGGSLIAARGAERSADAQIGILSNAQNLAFLSDILAQHQFVNAAAEITQANNVRASVNEARARAGELSRFGDIVGTPVGPGLTRALLRAQVEGTAEGLADEGDAIFDANTAVQQNRRALEGILGRVPGQLRAAGLEGAEQRAIGDAARVAGTGLVNASLFARRVGGDTPTVTPEGGVLGLNPRGLQGAENIDFAQPSPSVLPPATAAESNVARGFVQPLPPSSDPFSLR